MRAPSFSEKYYTKTLLLSYHRLAGEGADRWEEEGGR